MAALIWVIMKNQNVLGDVGGLDDCGQKTNTELAASSVEKLREWLAELRSARKDFDEPLDEEYAVEKKARADVTPSELARRLGLKRCVTCPRRFRKPFRKRSHFRKQICKKLKDFCYLCNCLTYPALVVNLLKSMRHLEVLVWWRIRYCPPSVATRANSGTFSICSDPWK